MFWQTMTCKPSKNNGSAARWPARSSPLAYLKGAKWAHLIRSHHKKTISQLHVVMVLTGLIMVIISQNIQTSNHSVYPWNNICQLHLNKKIVHSKQHAWKSPLPLWGHAKCLSYSILQTPPGLISLYSLVFKPHNSSSNKWGNWGSDWPPKPQGY